MTLDGANDRDKLTSLCKKTYKEQAIWFLNASWEGAGQRDSELFWNYVHKAGELDLQKKGTGSELDELNMHRFLESFKNERTVKELRDELRKVGVDNFKYIPLTMFLIWNYRFDWHKLVNAPQAANGAEIAKASEMLESSQRACNEAIRLADEASSSEKEAKAKATAAAASAKEAKATAAEAKARASEAEAAEADLKKADDELAAALAELKAQEDAFNNKTADLKKKSEEGSTVQKSKAANELAQHLASDPLPLRKAKTTTEAAKRKAEKARAPFAEATAKAQATREVAEKAAAEAEADRRASEKAAADAEAARQAAEDAVEEARRQVQEAEDYLEEQKKAGASSGQGTLWWLDRELQEQKKYMPQSKGGVRK